MTEKHKKSCINQFSGKTTSLRTAISTKKRALTIGLQPDRLCRNLTGGAVFAVWHQTFLRHFADMQDLAVQPMKKVYLQIIDL